MFPNPQDALPLPPHPNLNQYKKRAKDLLKANQSTDPAAIRTWAAEWIASLVRLSNLTITPQLPVRIDHWIDELVNFARKELPQTTWGRTHSSVPPSEAKRSAAATLTSAQFVIARAQGFESWTKLAHHIEAATRADSTVSNFERAADAIVTGDEVILEKLLRDHPDLVRARSTRQHQATLLHYVAANGVEGYRQKTPKNILLIAPLILQRGAEVNAIADVYGGSTTLALVATSVHPERARVQDALMQLLLDHGANIDSADSPPGALTSICLANGRAQAAEFLATRGAHLDLRRRRRSRALRSGQEVFRRIRRAEAECVHRSNATRIPVGLRIRPRRSSGVSPAARSVTRSAGQHRPDCPALGRDRRPRRYNQAAPRSRSIARSQECLRRNRPRPSPLVRRKRYSSNRLRVDHRPAKATRRKVVG